MNTHEAFLASVASTFESVESRWDTSSYRTTRSLSSSAKAKKMKDSLVAWLTSQGVRVEKGVQSEYTFLLNGLRVALKVSFLLDSDDFWFQQIKDQEYDMVWMVGISPNDSASSWLVPKSVFYSEVEGVKGHHTGAQAVETKMVKISPSDPYAWLRPYGSTLSDTLKIIR